MSSSGLCSMYNKHKLKFINGGWITYLDRIHRLCLILLTTLFKKLMSSSFLSINVKSSVSKGKMAPSGSIATF